MQQLSKQDHYDFGLRALTSVLRYAGRKKRANPDMSDEEVITVESLAYHLITNVHSVSLQIEISNNVFSYQKYSKKKAYIGT